MYLTEDIIAICSGITYGLKGQQVEVLNESRDLILVSGNNGRFFVKPEKLSEEKVDKEKVEAVKPKKKK